MFYNFDIDIYIQKVGVGLPAKVFIDGRFLASLLTTPTVGEGFEEVFNKERAQAGPFLILFSMSQLWISMCTILGNASSLTHIKLIGHN